MSEESTVIPEAEHVMDNEQARLVHESAEWRSRLCIARRKDGIWMGEVGLFNETDRNKARVIELSIMWPKGGREITYEILPEKPWDGSPPKRIRKLFPYKVIELIKASPKNEMVRGWLLKVTKQLPPEDADTYKKLEEWIESLPIPKTAEIDLSRKYPSLKIDIGFSRECSGRCDFRGTELGDDEFTFEASEVIELIDEVIEDGDDFTVLMDKLEGRIREDVWDVCQDIDWSSDGDYRYSDEEMSESQDEEYSLNKTELRARVREWIVANHQQAVEPLDM